MSEIRYSLDALLDAAGMTLNQLRDVCPMGGRTYTLARTVGLTERQADRYACAVGLHPFLVWPEMADHALEDTSRVCGSSSCVERFVPVRQAQKWCSPACRKREQAKRYTRRRWAKDPAYVARETERRRAHYAEVAEYERALARRYYAENRAKVRARQDAARRAHRAAVKHAQTTEAAA